jgi:hypothetical protein
VAGRPKVNNGAAALRAARDILPYAVLFYFINFFIWYQGAPSPGNDQNLISNIFISSLFVAGFFFIGFARVRRNLRSSAEAAANQRVVVYQQPVYVQGPPPGYPYAPYPPQGAPPPGYVYPGYPQQPLPPQQGAPPALPQGPPPRTPPAPPAPPATERKRPPGDLQ